MLAAPRWRRLIPSIFCLPSASRGAGPLHDGSTDANGEFGPFDPGAGATGAGGGGGCPVSLDGVTRDFSLGDVLSGGGFSGGGSAGSNIEVTPDGGGDSSPIVPNPNGQGSCYIHHGVLTCNPLAWQEDNLPDPNGILSDAFTSGQGQQSTPWGTLLGYLAQKPWVASAIFSVGPEPGVAGVGPAGTVAWGPASDTLCLGAGLGASAGRNFSFGALLHNSGNVDKILSGWSVSGGLNAAFPSAEAGVGLQAILNGPGIAFGPSVGTAGVGVAATWSACVSF